MEQFELTIEFENAKAAVAFAHELERSEPAETDEFRVIFPTETANMDNELLQLLIMFMENGGLPALGGFFYLLREILRKLFPDKQVIVSKGKNKAKVSSKSTDEDLKKIARDFTSTRP